MPSFKKYLPVPHEWLVSNRAPMIVHDKVDRSEWIRVQLAVDNASRRLRHLLGSAIHRAHSDPSLVSLGSQSTEDYDTVDDDDVNEIDWTAVSPELDALCRCRKSNRRPTAKRTYYSDRGRC